LVAALGVRSGTLVAGLPLPATVLILSPRIRALDRSLRIPEQELSILKSVDLFAPLANQMMEAVAFRPRHVEVPPGAVITLKGEPGNRFYVIADGEVEVTRDGRPVARLGPGADFGEIALLRDVSHGDGHGDDPDDAPGARGRGLPRGRHRPSRRA
jgi:CRP-like cAMP-binding protein